MSTIDRMFIATNIELEDQAENPDRALCRFELWEILVRIAVHKFRDAEQHDIQPGDSLKAVEKLVKDFILKNSHVLPWQEFRDEDLWTRDVNLLFDANLDALQRIFKKYQNPKDFNLSYNDAISIVVRDS